MSNILETIIAYKKKEVEQRKKETAVSALEAATLFSRPRRSLKKSIKDAGKTGIIAEFKRKSPSKDIINDTATVAAVTPKYEQYGASGLSVLTDTHFFGGSNEDLIEACSLNHIPVLRKEFVIDEYQLIEARAIGADAILLIAECLTKKEVAGLTVIAKQLGLEVLLEMHSDRQLDKIGHDNDLIGINNRDLTTFKVDIDRSIELSEKLPGEVVRIAESGISDPAVILKMRKAGFDGFLMGEHFMKEKDPGSAFRNFVENLAGRSS